ncbi:glycosyltransferase family 4 protein [Georgenia wangjunii]|uniref:glycosyltransferase family 4 protein n=1 Tax=Georgenia wangjunii TaxID=3117730 RepID=UPI002F269229
MLVLSSAARGLALKGATSWSVAAGQGLRLVFAAPEDSWSDELRTYGTFVPLHGSVPLHTVDLVRLARDLSVLATAEDWDLVHVQSAAVAALWRIVAPARVLERTVYVSHGLPFQRSERSIAATFSRTAETVLARRTRAVATVSVEDRAWFARLPGRLRPQLLWRLPGTGVDVTGFRDAAGTVRIQGVRRPYALFCGDLTPSKDPMRAVEAVAWCRRHLDLGLVVIGEGPLREALVQAATERPWLVLVPHSLAMEAWIASAAVVLAPSRRESAPRVIVESLAAGVPVIARENRGSRELLGDGVGTLLPPSAGAEEWGRRIEEVLGAPVARALMLERAMAYDISAYRHAYSGLLDAILGSPATMAGPGAVIAHPRRSGGLRRHRSRS